MSTWNNFERYILMKNYLNKPINYEIYIQNIIKNKFIFILYS